MLRYFRIDFEYILFVGAGWCFLKLWIVLDVLLMLRFRFQRVLIGFWWTSWCFYRLMFETENYHCFLVKSNGNLPSRRLAAHLGLHTPHGATMMVGEHELNWKEGQAIVFDVPLMNKRCWRGSFLWKRPKFKASDVKAKDYFLCHKIFVEQAGKEMQKLWKLGSFDVPTVKTKWPCFVFVAVQPSIISHFLRDRGSNPGYLYPQCHPWRILGSSWFTHTTHSVDGGWKLGVCFFWKPSQKQ